MVTLTHPLRERILYRMSQGDSFSITIPVLTEMLSGISLLRRAKQNLTEWARLKPLFPCYIPDEVDAELAAERKDRFAVKAGN